MKPFFKVPPGRDAMSFSVEKFGHGIDITWGNVPEGWEIIGYVSVRSNDPSFKVIRKG